MSGTKTDLQLWIAAALKLPASARLLDAADRAAMVAHEAAWQKNQDSFTYEFKSHFEPAEDSYEKELQKKNWNEAEDRRLTKILSGKF
jgi:hypothetical protein